MREHVGGSSTCRISPRDTLLGCYALSSSSEDLCFLVYCLERWGRVEGRPAFLSIQGCTIQMNKTLQACPLRAVFQLKDHGAARWILAMERLAAPSGHPVQPLRRFPFPGSVYMCSEVKSKPVGKSVHVCPGRKVPADLLLQLDFSLSFSYQPQQHLVTALACISYSESLPQPPFPAQV